MWVLSEATHRVLLRQSIPVQYNGRCHLLLTNYRWQLRWDEPTERPIGTRAPVANESPSVVRLLE